MTPEMINVEGTWISHGRQTVEVTVSGNTVSWPSGAEAKLVVNHQQFWLTSKSGKLYSSADIKEDEEGDVTLKWTDGSVWSRNELMEIQTETQKEADVVVPTSTSPSSGSRSLSPSSGRRSPNVMSKLKKTFGFRERKKIHCEWIDASLSKAAVSDVQGKWIIDSSGSALCSNDAKAAQVDVVVDGSSVSWSTGVKASLKVQNQQFLLTSETGKIYLTGELSAHGSLRWTNGCVWKRPS
jgi:hypothetical protein